MKQKQCGGLGFGQNMQVAKWCYLYTDIQTKASTIGFFPDKEIQLKNDQLRQPAFYM